MYWELFSIGLILQREFTFAWQLDIQYLGRSNAQYGSRKFSHSVTIDYLAHHRLAEVLLHYI